MSSQLFSSFRYFQMPRTPMPTPATTVATIFTVVSALASIRNGLVHAPGILDRRDDIHRVERKQAGIHGKTAASRRSFVVRAKAGSPMRRSGIGSHLAASMPAGAADRESLDRHRREAGADAGRSHRADVRRTRPARHRPTAAARRPQAEELIGGMPSVRERRQGKGTSDPTGTGTPHESS